MTFGLEFQGWLGKKVRDSMNGDSRVSLNLRDRVLKEGKVLSNDIIGVTVVLSWIVWLMLT